jgi:hypothetical protein
MAEISTLAQAQPKAMAPLIACSLQSAELVGRNGPVPFMADVEIQNVSDKPLDIEYEMTVLQHLNLIVTDASGSVVSEGHFGDRFAPTEHPQTLHLEPGDKYSAKVSLFATAPGFRSIPGEYAVRAVYEYKKIRSVSTPVSVSVQA